MANGRYVGARPSSNDSLADKKYVDDKTATKADDASVIHNSGAETVNGKKTFSTPPASTTAPSVATDLSNKSYVDSLPTILVGDDGRPYFTTGGERTGSAQTNFLSNTFKPRHRNVLRSGVVNVTYTADAPANIPNQVTAPWYDQDKFTWQGGMLTATDNALISQNVIDGSTINGAYDLEFMFSGLFVSLMFRFQDGSDYQVFIDDQPTTQYTIRPSATGFLFMNFTFNDISTHKITISTGHANFCQALYDLRQAYLWKAPARKKVAFVSDSYGTGQYVDNTFSAIPHHLVSCTGWAIYRMGQGGTGYLNDGTGNVGGTGPLGISAYGSTSRLNALNALPADLDLLIVYGGANDGNQGFAAIKAAAKAYYAAVKNIRPNLPIVVVGIESGTLPQAFDINKNNTANTALKEAAAESSNVKAFIDQKNPEWITGTGDVAGPNGSGNADFFISADHVHPTSRGYEYYADRIAQALAKVVI